MSRRARCSAFARDGAKRSTLQSSLRPVLLHCRPTAVRRAGIPSVCTLHRGIISKLTAPCELLIARPGKSQQLYSSNADRHETSMPKKERRKLHSLAVYLLSLSVQFYILSRSIFFSTHPFELKKRFFRPC